jgi:hypothetical protein
MLTKNSFRPLLLFSEPLLSRHCADSPACSSKQQASSRNSDHNFQQWRHFHHPGGVRLRVRRRRRRRGTRCCGRRALCTAAANINPRGLRRGCRRRRKRATRVELHAGVGVRFAGALRPLRAVLADAAGAAHAALGHAGPLVVDTTAEVGARAENSVGGRACRKRRLANRLFSRTRGCYMCLVKERGMARWVRPLGDMPTSKQL